MASVIPELSRKSLILPALLFAAPLALAQGATIFFFGFGLITLTLPWLFCMLPWLFCMPVGFVLVGGLCSFRTTRNVPDETISENWGRFSGLLTGLLSSLLGFFALVLLLVWYTNWWIPRLSTQLPPGCVTHVTPLSCLSPQMGARWSLIALPALIHAFLLGNACFVLLARLGGALAGRFRARREIRLRLTETQTRSPAPSR